MMETIGSQAMKVLVVLVVVLVAVVFVAGVRIGTLGAKDELELKERIIAQMEVSTDSALVYRLAQWRTPAQVHAVVDSLLERMDKL